MYDAELNDVPETNTELDGKVKFNLTIFVEEDEILDDTYVDIENRLSKTMKEHNFKPSILLFVLKDNGLERISLDTYGDYIEDIVVYRKEIN